MKGQSLRILIDILHPAHVHLFRNFIVEMRAKGHSVFITSRQKDVTESLLEKYHLQHTTLSAIGNKKSALFTEFGIRTWRLFRYIREMKPDLLMGVMGVSIAPLGRLLGIPSLVFYGTESAKLTNGIVYRACTRYVTPAGYRIEMGKKHIRYNAFPEQAYLHPNRFNANPDVLKPLGLDENQTFTILRFVGWGASHDFGHTGLSLAFKRKALEAFQKFGTVFISSEKPLPEDLEAFRLRIQPDHLHHILHFATLLYGESATLASEAAMLGTSGIYLDNMGRGFTDQLESDFGLVHNFTESEKDQQASIQRGVDLLADPETKTKALQKAKSLHESTEDLTAYMIRLAEKYGKRP